MSLADDSDGCSSNSVSRRSTFSLPQTPHQTSGSSSTVTPLFSLGCGFRSRSSSDQRNPPEWRRTTDVSSIMDERYASPVRDADWQKHREERIVRKLQRELDQNNQKISSLTTQLATKTHVVMAFEQLLESVKMQISQYEAASDQKDIEINKLKSRFRQDLEEIRKPSPADEETKLISNLPSKQHDGKQSSACKSIKKSAIPKPKSGLPMLVKRDSMTTSKTSLPEAASTAGNVISAQNQNKHPDSLSLRTLSIDSFSIMSEMDQETAKQLEKELLEKEKTLTDLQLESLTTSDQLQSMDELVSQLTSELADLRVTQNRSC